jgi:hypothetical protein
VRSDSPFDFAGLDAGRADFELFDRFVDDRSNGLQIGHPAPLVMGIKVRTQECVIDPGNRALAANITTLCHNFLSEMSLSKNACQPRALPGALNQSRTDNCSLELKFGRRSKITRVFELP